LALAYKCASDGDFEVGLVTHQCFADFVSQESHNKVKLFGLNGDPSKAVQSPECHKVFFEGNLFINIFIFLCSKYSFNLIIHHFISLFS
jgi:hypothetical protein